MHRETHKPNLTFDIKFNLEIKGEKLIQFHSFSDGRFSIVVGKKKLSQKHLFDYKAHVIFNYLLGDFSSV